MYKIVSYIRKPNNFTPFYLFYRKYSLENFKPFYHTFFQYPDNFAVIDNHGAYSYKDILYSSFLLAEKIKNIIPSSFKGERISFLCSNDATYVSVLLSCWITGNVAVPLCSNHPRSLLEYYIKDSDSKLIIANAEFSQSMQTIASDIKKPFFIVDHDMYKTSYSENLNELSKSEFFSWDSNLCPKRALIIYTSGTTGLPKGVVLTHGNLHVQISAVVESWKISPEDSILHALPLHHIHGIMNALLCILSVGGTVVMQKKFDALQAWKYFLQTDSIETRVNLFFAVPTMYAKLLEHYSILSKKEDFTRKRCLENLRMMSSGSMALPVPVFQRWEEITGHKLVERFGMSEIGMALSNPLEGPRLPGFVGIPLPEVELKISKNDPSQKSGLDIVTASYNNINVLPDCEGTPGDLLIKGPNVFKEYWNKEKATLETFTEDNWFKTGDTACVERGSFKILGRTSVDIIKSGGYKISALEVESCLLRHPDILECTVFGIEDNIWGERVAALVKFHKQKIVTDNDIKTFCKSYLPKYAVPTVIKHVDEIPRNVMGKVNKKELRANTSF